MALTRGVVDLVGPPTPRDLIASDSFPTALTNPHTGFDTLEALGSGKQAYGVVWQTVGFPAGAGRAERGITIFELAFLSLTTIYTLVDDVEVVGNNLLTRTHSGLWMFDPLGPVQLIYSITAGWSVEFRWLIVP